MKIHRNIKKMNRNERNNNKHIKVEKIDICII